MSGSRSPTNYFEDWKLKPGTWLNQKPWHHHFSCNTETNLKRVEKVVHFKKKKEVTNIIQIHLPNSLAKFRLKLEKVGTTTRPFSYDLSQIPYSHTGEVTNWFKGLNLIDRVPKEVCTEVHDIVQKAGIKMIPKKKKCKNTKWLFEKASQIAE